MDCRLKHCAISMLSLLSNFPYIDCIMGSAADILILSVQKLINLMKVKMIAVITGDILNSRKSGFFDTSSLFKLYHKESGIQELMDFFNKNSAERIYLAETIK